LLDPRTPVLIGAGQLTNRVDRGDATLEPAAMMAEAARRAADDARAGTGLLASIDSVRVVMLLSWRYRDPGLAVARRIGADPADTALGSVGGNTPQALVNEACLDIQEGRTDLVLLCGAEAWRSRMAARMQVGSLGWEEQDAAVEPARTIGGEFQMSSPEEIDRGIQMPVQAYPLFEQAIRIGLGRSVGEHLVAVSELWARFSEVAARNPYAWIQEPKSPEEIRTPSADNRWIGFPYTKLMNSNNNVEQSAAVLLCSVERADALGVPRDRWVFPHAGADAHDRVFMSNRADLRTSPAIRIAGREALELAGAAIDDIAHVDLYSCFPSAVEISAAELGLGLDRDLTVTGGLSFAGGPWNNYVLHSIAAMAGLLRDDPGTLGLVTANGGHIAKHAIGVYGSEPPAAGYRHSTPQAEIDAEPGREVCGDPDGEAEIESWTVMHDRSGAPERGILPCLLDDGRRAWGVTNDPDHLQLLLTDDVAGRRVELRPDGQVDLG
jgi:acetyl-CoA C-acetyltransferase